MTIVELENVSKSYEDKNVLNNLSFKIEEGTFNVIMGASGSGKSTILNIIGLLDKATSGDVILFGQKNIRPFSMKAEQMLKNFALIENETVANNLKLALENVRGNKKEKISVALKEVGLEGYENKKIFKCSGGEQQRVAIARLLLKPCELILADEPTGSLDIKNREIVVKLLKNMQEQGKTIIVVSHDPFFEAIADNVIDLSANIK